MDLVALRLKRKKEGKTQEYMSEKLGYKNKSGYNMLENGFVKIDIEKSLIIKEILNMTDEEYQKIFLI